MIVRQFHGSLDGKKILEEVLLLKEEKKKKVEKQKKAADEKERVAVFFQCKDIKKIAYIRKISK